MSLQLSASRPRQLQYSGKGLRRDLRLLEVDEGLLAEISKSGCADHITVLARVYQAAHAAHGSAWLTHVTRPHQAAPCS